MKITQLLASLALLATGARAATSLFSFYADTDPATLPYFDSGYESDLPGFYPPIHCISGEDITLVFAEFTIDDEKEGFCLQGYKEPECRDQDLDYIYQWNMSFLDPYNSITTGRHHLKTPVKSAKVIPGSCPTK